MRPITIVSWNLDVISWRPPLRGGHPEKKLNINNVVLPTTVLARMDREQVFVTAGFIFIGVSTLALWTLSAAHASRNPYRLLDDGYSLPLEMGEDQLRDVQTRPLPPGMIIRTRPPGPCPDWLIGNLRQLPKGSWCDAFAAWQKLYGDVFYLSALGRGILVVNSLAVAEELTVKRSNIYSGRPVSTMMGKLMGWDWTLTSMNPSVRHTESRKLLREFLRPEKLPIHDSTIERHLAELIRALNGFSGHPLQVVTNAVAIVIIRVSYGDGVWSDVGKELIQLNAVTTRHLNWAAGQFWPVEHIPILRYTPGWMPGSEFKLVAKEGYALQRKVRNWGFLHAVKHYRQKTLGTTSLAGEYINAGLNTEQFGLLRDVLGVVYGAGVDTTASTITIFFAVMLVHPHIQAKIHKELDKVLGADLGRILTSLDRPGIPYTEAAWKEAMRWMPALPLGVPHASLSDDIYNGWHIPKETMVFLHTGFMCRDPRLWEEPDVYKPERWLTSHNPRIAHLPHIYDIVFGWGLRACPGVQLADRVGFSLAIGVLCSYEIVPPEGKPIPTPDSFVYDDAYVRYPLNLDCYFRPRCQSKPRAG